MTRPLIVWGGATYIRDMGQRRVLVAAPTKKRAVELMNECFRFGGSLYDLNKYWSKTGNDVELSVATEEGVWLNTDERRGLSRENYVRMEPRKEG